MGQGEGEGGMEGEKKEEIGRKKSPGLLGHPQPAPGSSTDLEMSTGTPRQTSQSAPQTQPCEPQTSWCPALGCSCPRDEAPGQLLPGGAEQSELGPEFCGREEGAAPSPVPGH